MGKIKFFDLDYLEKNGIPKVDYHSHTSYTDGAGTPLEYAIEARKKGLEVFAITEHIWRTSEWLDEFLEDVRKASKIANVIPGVEAKQINMYGDIDVKNSDAKKVDLVLGSVHAYPTNEDYQYIDPKNIPSKKEALKIETEALLSLATNKYIDVIAHPYVLYKKHFKENKIPKEFAREVILAAIENDVALEVNTRYRVPSKEFLKMALELGAKISLGSDAHKPNELGNILVSLIEEVVEDLR